MVLELYSKVIKKSDLDSKVSVFDMVCELVKCYDILLIKVVYYL